MPQWPSISRDDLLQAAGTAGFDADLPILVRRLIQETGRGVTRLHVPGGSGTSAGGFDGVVVAEEQTTFVPSGTSVWELSVQKTAQSKADSDYAKRLTGPNGEDPGEITYVQLGLAPWPKAPEWEAARRSENRWHDVRAYNADSLDTWLSGAPVTTVWLAERLGKAFPGVREALTWWEDTWLPSTSTPLDAAVVLANREGSSSLLLREMSSGPTIITVGGGLRGDELRAFVAASLTTAPAHDRTPARTLFVSSRDSLLGLLRQPDPLVLVATDPELASDVPLTHPHRIVIPVTSGDATVDVPRLDGEAVTHLLTERGFEHEAAYHLGTLARRSLPALRRRLAVYPDTLVPKWARSPQPSVRRHLLLGGWNETKPADRAAVEEFAESTYADFAEAALPLTTNADAFLALLRGHWHVVSPDDSWHLLAPHLTAADVQQFERLALRVLGEVRPEPDDLGVVHAEDFADSCSAQLREGVARSLALLGTSDEFVTLSGGMTGSLVARRIVRTLLAHADADPTYSLWSSLSDLLPSIAEAAPEEFLAALRAGLEGANPSHRAMFADHQTSRFGFPGGSAHLGFLRALDVLAWSPDNLDDVADVLTRLAALDPGGRWANRPARSLEEIFSCWHPQTSATGAHRLSTLGRLLRTAPEATRKLLVALIPRGHGTLVPHRGPKYRDWTHEQDISRSEMWENIAGVADLLLADLDAVPARHLPIIDKIDRLPSAQRDSFASSLARLGMTADDETRARLADAMRVKIAEHREFADADWTLAPEELEPLARALAALEPQAPVYRLRWLFESPHLLLADHPRRPDFAAHGAELSRRRVAAIGEIFGTGGLAAVATLASKVSYPFLIGRALAEHTSTLDLELLPELGTAHSPMRQVAIGYLQTRLDSGGQQLLHRLLAAADRPDVQATVLNCLADARAAWEVLAGLPQARHDYWSAFNYHSIDPSSASAVTAVSGLLEAGRIAPALEVVAYRADEADSAEMAELAVLALSDLVELKTLPAGFEHLSEHDFRRVFALLARHRDLVGAQRVATLEWQLFPLLRFAPEAPTLHATLAEEPVFFVELVTRAFFRENEELGDGPSETDDRAAVATRAFEVLRTWRRCPGAESNQPPNPDGLRAWVREARDRLAQVDRLSAGDYQIGHVLAHASPDPDGLRPPRVVRDLLEELRSDEVDAGLRDGIFNRRGIYSEGFTEGGVQDRSLAEKYRAQAAESNDWPRTRRMFRELAETYEQHAHHSDDRAERRRRGLPD
ncbi:hypothetical protein ACSHWB_38355 [Lentzea sp. HUAS TT2]|uniref:hypothetical protein n=1 Tax=Lentzea sp. HUAS TT2 TaxID=3447454 RepID=UPI003F71F9D1